MFREYLRSNNEINLFCKLYKCEIHLPRPDDYIHIFLMMHFQRTTLTNSSLKCQCNFIILFCSPVFHWYCFI